MSKLIVLDSIRSMLNVWAIFRNSDWAWFEKVYLCWYTPFPPRKDIHKTALWAENFIDWEFHNDILKLIKKLRKEWYKIYSIELDKRSIDYRNLFDRKDEKVCLVLWNELSWVSKQILDLSDDIFVIDMKWKKESLNVSVAAWIVMFALA